MSLFRVATVPKAMAFALAAASVCAEPPLSVEQYVEVVVANHPSGSESEALTRAAAAERTAARLLPDPLVEVSRSRAHGLDGPRFTEKGLAVTQTIPWPGTITAGIRAGDRAAEALRASAEGLRWELMSAARRAFARLLAARQRLAIARGAEVDARTLRDLVQRRAELGAARESDRIKADIEWRRQQRAMQSLEQETQTAEAMIRALAGRDLARPLSLVGDLPSQLPAIDREELLALAARNPRARGAQSEAEKQAALASVARRGRIPNLDLKVFRDHEIDKQATGASLELRVPLWNANRGEIARAEAAAAVARAAADRAKLEATVELSERLRDIEVAAGEAALFTNDLDPQSAESLRLARLLYEEGETSLLDLLDAQRTWREVQREAIDARLALAVAVADIQSLVGPGFNPWR